MNETIGILPIGTPATLPPIAVGSSSNCLGVVVDAAGRFRNTDAAATESCS